MEILQVEGIGLAKARKLNEAGVKTVRRLSELEFYHIERLLSRNPPFGQQIRHHLAGFPKLDLTVQTVSPRDLESKSTAVKENHVIVRLFLLYRNSDLPVWKKQHPWTTLVIEGDDGRLLWFWRGSVKRLTDRKELLVSLEARRQETIHIVFACEAIVGTLQRKSIKLE